MELRKVGLQVSSYRLLPICQVELRQGRNKGFLSPAETFTSDSWLGGEVDAIGGNSAGSNIRAPLSPAKHQAGGFHTRHFIEASHRSSSTEQLVA